MERPRRAGVSHCMRLPIGLRAREWGPLWGPGSHSSRCLVPAQRGAKCPAPHRDEAVSHKQTHGW